MPRVFGGVFAIMFILTICGMIAMGIWNYKLYRDCRADGHASYECQAMLSPNSRGVVVDDISKR